MGFHELAQIFYETETPLIRPQTVEYVDAVMPH